MGAILTTGALVVGCAPTTEARAPEYLGSVARLVTDDVIQAEVRFRGTPEVGQAYALCAASLAASLRGDVWLRHLRTVSQVEAGIRRHDTLYTLSPSRPEGADPIRARTALEDCETNGIPVV